MKDKMPREYAETVLKKLPNEVNRLLDEESCPGNFRQLAKDYIYNGLAIAWNKRQGRK